MGEQIVDPAIGPAAAERGEELGEVGTRFESARFGGGDHREHASESGGAAIGSGKEPRRRSEATRRSRRSASPGARQGSPAPTAIAGIRLPKNGIVSFAYLAGCT